jgi:hypothetical protein
VKGKVKHKYLVSSKYRLVSLLKACLELVKVEPVKVRVKIVRVIEATQTNMQEIQARARAD